MPVSASIGLKYSMRMYVCVYTVYVSSARDVQTVCMLYTVSTSLDEHHCAQLDIVCTKRQSLLRRYVLPSD